LVSPPAEHGLALGHTLNAVRLEITPSLGTTVELKTTLSSQSLQTNVSVSLSETSLVRTGLHVSLGTFVLSQPLLTLNTDVTAGSDAPASGGVGAGVGGQTPVGIVGSVGNGNSGGVVIGINPTPAPVLQLSTVPGQPAVKVALPFVSSPVVLAQATNPNAATAVAITATENASANLVGRAQPAFLLQPVSTGAASSMIPAVLGQPDVTSQAPSGGRLPRPDVDFAEGGADEPEQLNEPDFELPPAPQGRDRPDPDAALFELGLAGASPEAGFVPGLSDDAGEDEAAPLIQAGLGGDGNLSSWLLFAVAVSGLAVARLAAPQPRRRRGQFLHLLADESSIS